MSLLEVSTLEGKSIKLDNAAIDALDENLRGTVIFPNSDGYDDARQIWNGMIDRKPGMIVRCAGTADVVSAVNFGRDHGLLVSVKGGGHNVSGNAVCDGGLMIDLSGMRSVHVNPETKRARAEGGATWGDFDAATQLFGLASVGGLISNTGVAGLTLGGGIGWLSPSYGLACDNLISADVVTANGEVITASAEENDDLFWGLKGGGGNFGVTTSFEFQLYPVGPQLFGGMILYPLGEAQDVLENFVEFMSDASDKLGAMAGFTTTPDGMPVVAIIAVYNGSIVEGETTLEPLRSYKSPILDTMAASSYRKIQTLFDAGVPTGARYYWKSSFLDRLPSDALSAVIEQAKNRPSLQSKIFLEFFHGKSTSISKDSAVFDHRTSPYNYLVIGQWDSEEEDEINRQWTRECWRAMDSYASDRVYVNYLGTEADEGVNRLEEAYGSEKFQKLQLLKRKYDPLNLFRMNQNIPPTG